MRISIFHDTERIQALPQNADGTRDVGECDYVCIQLVDAVPPPKYIEPACRQSSRSRLLCTVVLVAMWSALVDVVIYSDWAARTCAFIATEGGAIYMKNSSGTIGGNMLLVNNTGSHGGGRAYAEIYTLYSTSRDVVWVGQYFCDKYVDMMDRPKCISSPSTVLSIHPDKMQWAFMPLFTRPDSSLTSTPILPPP